jgi:hypothetical protein
MKMILFITSLYTTGIHKFQVSLAEKFKKRGAFLRAAPHMVHSSFLFRYDINNFVGNRDDFDYGFSR